MIRELISQLAVLSAVCTCVLIICPDTAFKKYVRLACSLCVLSIIISFLPFDMTSYDTADISVPVTDLTDEAERLITEQTAKRISEAIYELAYTKYGIERDGISADVSYGKRQDGETELTGAKIQLNGIRYAVYTVPLKNSVSELLGIPCEVIINE